MPIGELVGGSHVLVADDLSTSVIVRDSAQGLLIVGDYSRVIHTNMATYGGGRFIINFYGAKEIGPRVARREQRRQAL